jgi:putative protease
MELLSPAGNKEAFVSAVNNGADSVYLGLSMFNAIKPARNFRFEELSDIIRYAHSKKVRVYVTLNTELKSSELEDAARILHFLKEVKADAVIVKDFALIYMLEKHYSPYEFHMSTQFGVANTAAMEMAEKLGAARVVLARELNSAELKALSRPYFPQTEVFAQGSMCFSFSGKCLMSSWFGGKSANRGTCQAPCRFRFTPGGSDEASSPFSMKDLNLSKRLSELSGLGVSALKIEGRLKSAEWVGEVTRFYRNLLDNADPGGADPARFTGREQGEGFFGGLEGLITTRNSGTVNTGIRSTPEDRRPKENSYDLKITAGNEIKFNIATQFGDAGFAVRVKAVLKENRGVYLSELQERLNGTAFGGLFLGRFELEKDFLIPKSQLKNIVSGLGAVIAPLSRKEAKFLKSLKIPHKLEFEINNRESDPKNSINIEFANANILKIRSGDIEQIMDGIRDAGIKKVIVTEPDSDLTETYKKLAAKVRVEISLFPILFESELEDCRMIISSLEHTNNISYEANDIGHLRLLKGTSKKIDCGPGLSPYNFLAVKRLKELGLASAHIPFEADIETLDGLKSSPLPLRITIYSRIPLFYTRAISENFKEGASFSDREGFRFSVSRYNGISIFHSEDYFTIYGVDLSEIRTHEIIIDLSGEDNILYKFQKLKKEPSLFPGMNFNLNRKLF